jgi:drug/metabolite transporter (DMT)-like permease
VLTAVFAILVLREEVLARQWFGLLLGVVGVTLVLLEKMGGSAQIDSFPLSTLAWALIALVGISAGTVYQKRHGQGVALIPATFIQYCAAAILFTLGAFVFETRAVDWTMQLLLATGWLVLGLSVGAVLLLMQLIQRGAASRVASLFYLVPPVTALEAYVLFDERLGIVALCGGLLTVIAVALVMVKKQIR